jgi:hypothetical protein
MSLSYLLAIPELPRIKEEDLPTLLQRSADPARQGSAETLCRRKEAFF